MASMLGSMNTQLVNAYAKTKQYEIPAVATFAQAFKPVVDKAIEVGSDALSGFMEAKQIAREELGGERIKDVLPGRQYKEERRALGRQITKKMRDEKDAKKTELTEEEKARINLYNKQAASYDQALNVPNIAVGCMHPKATNYDSSATADNGTCTFDDEEMQESYDAGFAKPPETETETDIPGEENADGENTNVNPPYSPFRQLANQPVQKIDYEKQLSELINRPNIDQLNIQEFTAMKVPLDQAIKIASEEEGAESEVMGLMNQFRALNEEEKEIKKLVVTSAEGISRGAKDSVTKVFAGYLNPASKKVLVLDPTTNKYQYATETPEGSITQEQLIKAVDEGTTNDAAKALQLKYTNSIIKQEKDATVDKPKDMNYFMSLAKNVVDADKNKIIDLIYGDVREGGNFADDLRENPEMLGLPDELKEETYNAIINPDNPNFNRDVTNGLLQQYYALDLKKTYDSVKSGGNKSSATNQLGAANKSFVKLNIPNVKITV